MYSQASKEIRIRQKIITIRSLLSRYSIELLLFIN
jgi:hypothetical protein